RPGRRLHCGDAGGAARGRRDLRAVGDRRPVRARRRPVRAAARRHRRRHDARPVRRGLQRPGRAVTLAIERLADLGAIAPAAWNALLQRSATRTVFQTWQWHAAWWQVFGPGAELVLLVARRGGELAGLGAFWRQRRVLRFVGHGRSDYGDLLC